MDTIVYGSSGTPVYVSETGLRNEIVAAAVYLSETPSANVILDPLIFGGAM